jgi:cell division protein FtsW (lipid II flippase)
MGNSTAQPQPRRTIFGCAGPVVCALMAFAMIVGILISAVPTDGSTIVLTLTFSLMAFVVEQTVQRQLTLAAVGRTAQALIDDTHQAYFRGDHCWVKYHFTTEAGQLIDGRSPVSSEDLLVYTQGSPVDVFYDPENPRTNMLAQAMWAVTWDE